MNHPEIEEIKKEFYLLGLLQKEAYFESYIDNIFGYELKHLDKLHELTIINKKATFLRNEKIVDLLDFKGTKYLCHRVFCLKTDNLISEKTFIKKNKNDKNNNK